MNLLLSLAQTYSFCHPRGGEVFGNSDPDLYDFAAGFQHSRRFAWMSADCCRLNRRGMSQAKIMPAGVRGESLEFRI
jgi:hypothetical protein